MTLFLLSEYVPAFAILESCHCILSFWKLTFNMTRYFSTKTSFINAMHSIITFRNEQSVFSYFAQPMRQKDISVMVNRLSKAFIDLFFIILIGTPRPGVDKTLKWEVYLIYGGNTNLCFWQLPFSGMAIDLSQLILERGLVAAQNLVWTSV